MIDIRRIPYWAVVALLVYMPFHVFLSQSLSLATDGLDAWKIGKDVFLAVATLFTICLVWQRRRADKLFYCLLSLGLLYGLLHIVLWAVHPDIYQKTSILGIIYNIRLPACLLLAYGAARLNPDKFAFSSVIKLVLGVSTAVAALGLVQYLLPKDILTHLGYSLPRGVEPAFFIDDNPAFPRIMSTLRDPNSLGAFLILPLSALTYYLFRIARYATKRRVLIAALWLVHMAALYLTFSRSAWAGALLAMGLVVYWQFSSLFVRYLRKYWWAGAVLILLAAGTLFALRNNAQVDGIFTHATAAQKGPLNSNQYHWYFVRRGLDGIAAQPLGHGPGTAGVVSIQNPHGGLLTENYYVQIGYEVGVLGLAVFVALNGLVYVWLLRRHDLWTVVLLTSFWGYVLMNMLLHTWSNEAVAAQWWLLAGAGLASAKGKSSPKRA